MTWVYAANLRGRRVPTLWEVSITPVSVISSTPTVTCRASRTVHRMGVRMEANVMMGRTSMSVNVSPAMLVSTVRSMKMSAKTPASAQVVRLVLTR